MVKRAKATGVDRRWRLAVQRRAPSCHRKHDSAGWPTYYADCGRLLLPGSLPVRVVRKQVVWQHRPIETYVDEVLRASQPNVNKIATALKTLINPTPPAQ